MKYGYLMIFISLFANFSFGQDSTNIKKDELHHGIEFQVNGLFNLNNFNGYTFAYRYRFNRDAGLRIGLNADVNNEDYDITQQIDTAILNPPNYYHYYKFKLSVQYLYSLIKYKNFTLFTGGGPFISLDKEDRHSESLGTVYTLKYSHNTKTFGYGLDAVLGVEYQLIDNVLISGEYGITFAELNTKIDYNDIFDYNPPNEDSIRSQSGERDDFTIKGTAANLGISIFF